MMIGKSAWFLSFVLRILLPMTMISCQTTYQTMEPTIICPVSASRVCSLPSPFPSLSLSQRETEWGKELHMGEVFARECDFYRAITCYKRALILLPPEEIDRRLQLEYSLIYCYYLGGKYQESLNLFGTSDLSQGHPSFPAFNNLLVIIYDCYLQTKQEDKAECVREIIQKFSGEASEDLLLYQSLKNDEIESARCVMSQHSQSEEIQKDFAFYDQFAKSPRIARTLNAVLPGAGYYYVGQRRSALTSFVINALFSAAAFQFFHRGYHAAGAITLSLEMGWYLGGINGAGIEAHEFNTRLYENVCTKILTDSACFPILMFETSF